MCSREPSFKFVPIDGIVKIDGKKVKNIVIEGGGMRIIPACGALKFLEEKKVLHGVEKYAGSSAGSILAAALACGVGVDRIERLMLTTNFNKFKDDSYGFFRDTNRIFNEYGKYKGEYMLKWINKQLSLFLGIESPTFNDLYKKTGNRLYVTSFCVEDRKIRIFSLESTPHLTISSAVRMSMAIPIFFKPIIYEGKHYVDGGVSNNYPIDLFGEGNMETLGIKLMGDGEKRHGEIYDTAKIDSFTSYVMTLMNGIFIDTEKNQMRNNYWERTLSICTGNIDTVEFGISKEKRRQSIEVCYGEMKRNVIII